MESVEASLEYIPGYYLRCTLTWQPEVTTVFAGKTDYPKQDIFDRIVIRPILFVTHDPADPHSVTGFSDWQQLENFTGVIVHLWKKSSPLGHN